MSNKLIENLPYYGYQDNKIVQWLCGSIQPEIEGVGAAWKGYQDHVLSGDRLDDQAGLLGIISIGFWDPHWEDSKKLEVLASIPGLLPYYGTRKCLVQALTLLVPAFLGLWTGGELFLADVSILPVTLGSPEPLRYYIQLNSGVSRTDEDWLLSVKLAEIFTPLIVETRVTYGAFYADLSMIGDPVFQ